MEPNPPNPEIPAESSPENPRPSSGSAPRPGRRRLLLALLGLALLYPLYLGLANFFLSSPLGPWALNLRPKRLTVHWSQAWSLYPGDLRVRDLKVRGDSARAKWLIDVDRGQGWIDLPALLGRRFRLADFEGTGVRSVTLRKPAQGRPAGKKGAARRPGWRLAFERVRLHNVREIVLDRVRLVGSTEVSGSFTSQVGGPLRLAKTEVRSPKARLLGGSQLLAQDLDLAAVLSISPYAPREHGGVKGFDFVSGTLDAGGLTAGTKGGGRVALHLKLERGLLQPGTDLRWTTAQGGAAAPAPAPQPPLPAGFLRLEVAPGAAGTPALLQLKAELDDLTIGGSDGRPPTFSARALSARSSTSETRLSTLLTAARQLRRGAPGEADAWVAEVEASPVDLGSIGLRRNWSLHLDRAAGRLSLSALVRRGISISGLRAEGVSGRVDLLDRPGPLPERSSRAWAIQLIDAEVRGVRDLGFNAFSLRGDLAASGGFRRDREGEIEVTGARAELERGEILHQGKAVARDLFLHAALDLPPVYPAAHPGVEMLWLADAALSGTGKALGGAPRRGAPARRGAPPEAMNLDLRLEKGVLAEDTQVALTVPSLPFSDFARFGQPLFLAATVTDGRLDVSAEARELTLGARPGRPPLFTAQRATLSTSTPERRLAKLLPRRGQAKGGALLEAGLLGDLSAEALTIGGLSGQGVWGASADRGGARIDLSALRDKQLRLSEVTATGVALRLDPLPAGTSRPAAPPGAWSIEARGLRLTQIRSLAFGPDRILGPAALSGDVGFDPRRRLTLRRVRFSLPLGQAASGREVAGRDLSVQAELDLAPASAGAPETGLAFFRRLSGGFQAKGKITSLGFLRRYLKASWLDIKGSGDLDAGVRLVEGRLQAGSKVSVERGQFRATIFDGLAEGGARLSAAVEGGKVRVRAAFDRFQVRSAADGTDLPFVRGQGLSLDLSSANLDLATPANDLRATVDLPRAEVPDLRAYNVYLPPQAGAEILGGRGAIDAHFELDGAANTARGQVHLDSDQVEGRFQELELGGRLKLAAILASRDLKGREFALDGTKLDFDRVSYAETGAKEASAPGWWARLRLNEGTMTWARPLALDSRFEVRMKDSGLLLNLVAQRKTFLHWFEGVLTVEDVAARGELAFRQGAIEVDPLRVEGGKLDLRTRLRYSKEHKTADLFVRYGKFATGVALRDGKRDFKILGPEEWFEKREGWGKK